jgi:arsenate reductase
LFLCTGNSARSILAEAMANHAPITGGKFRAFSAGSHPRGVVDPLAIEILQQAHIPTDGLRSKSWDEFNTPAAPRLDFVLTVCDQAADEPCPVWPGQPMVAHWGVPDPAAVTSSDIDRHRAFRDAALVLRRRIELFASLPFDKLTRLALQARVNDIGRASSAVTPAGTPIATSTSMHALTVTDVTRIATEAAREQSADLQIVAVTLGGEGNYAEVIIDIEGCRSEPCRFSVGGFRDALPATVHDEIAGQMPKHMRDHGR